MRVSRRCCMLDEDAPVLIYDLRSPLARVIPAVHHLGDGLIEVGALVSYDTVVPLPLHRDNQVGRNSGRNRYGRQNLDAGDVRVHVVDLRRGLRSTAFNFWSPVDTVTPRFHVAHRLTAFHPTRNIRPKRASWQQKVCRRLAPKVSIARTFYPRSLFRRLQSSRPRA